MRILFIGARRQSRIQLDASSILSVAGIPILRPLRGADKKQNAASLLIHHPSKGLVVNLVDPGSTGSGKNLLETPAVIDRTSIRGKTFIADRLDENRRVSVLISYENTPYDEKKFVYTGIFESSALRIPPTPVKCGTRFIPRD